MSNAMHDRAVESQNKIWQRMQEIMSGAESEGRDLTAEERSNWDAAEADLAQVSKDIERFANFANLDTVDRSQIVSASAPVEENQEDRDARYGEAFGTYLRGGMEKLSPELRSLMESRADVTTPQAAGTDSAGGYTVPEGFRNVMAETMKAYGGVLNIANVINTSSGNPLVWPTNDDTDNIGALLDENTQVTVNAVSFGQRTLGAYTYTSKMVKVSLQLLQDSAFSLDSWLPRKLGERIGRAVAAHLTTGTGSGQPQGVTAAASALTGDDGATAGAAPGITYDNLVDLEHSIDPAYRTNTRYLFHDKTLAMLRKLKDSDGRPMWVPVPTSGMAATINGQPYTVDNSMPEPTDGKKAIVFGDFKAGYIVRNVRDVQVLRLAERYADYLQVAYLGFSRLDAKLDDTDALRSFTMGSTGA